MIRFEERCGPVLHGLRKVVHTWRVTHGVGDEVVVALSGGADSLALTAAAVAAGCRVHAIVVDHQLQAGSDVIARTAAARAREVGCASADVVPVTVGSVGGPEAAARDARYTALLRYRAGRPVLLAHTMDDQAETVLLGLARGSGLRSIAGMRSFDDPWGRPFLAQRRQTTRAACDELGIEPYDDPHNRDSRFTRVRVRHEVLPLLHDVLGPGVTAALARTASFADRDASELDAQADRVRIDAGEADISQLHDLPDAVRTRVLHRWLTVNGAQDISSAQIQAVDALIIDWHGQGPCAIGGGSGGARLVVSRRHGRLGIGRVGDDMDSEPPR